MPKPRRSSSADGAKQSQESLTDGVNNLTLSRAVSGVHKIVVEGLVIQQGEDVCVPLNCIFVRADGNKTHQKDVNKRLIALETDANSCDIRNAKFCVSCDIDISKITNPITGVVGIHTNYKTKQYLTKKDKEKKLKYSQKRRELLEKGKEAVKKEEEEEVSSSSSSSSDDEAPAKRNRKKKKSI